MRLLHANALVPRFEHSATGGFIHRDSAALMFTRARAFLFILRAAPHPLHSYRRAPRLPLTHAPHYPNTRAALPTRTYYPHTPHYTRTPQHYCYLAHGLCRSGRFAHSLHDVFGRFARSGELLPVSRGGGCVLGLVNAFLRWTVRLTPWLSVFQITVARFCAGSITTVTLTLCRIQDRRLHHARAVSSYHCGSVRAVQAAV